ncbi:MAG: hypothetical protein DRP90_05545 [Planctomycetota bacterium]|nr:MAG: hypothetical protein DRP90_05545 [Planctomycetota bacterium]
MGPCHHSTPLASCRRTAFDRVATLYDRAADVQQAVGRRLLNFLQQHLGSFLPPAPRILEIGAGTGLYTRLLLRRFPSARITALDPSRQMLRRLLHQLDSPLVSIRPLALPPQSSRQRPYDLVTSNCALHWTEDLPAVFQRLHALAGAGTGLAFSIMVRGTFPEVRAVVRRVAPAKSHPADLPDPAAVIAGLRAAGWKLEGQVEEDFTVFYPDARTMLATLHRQGVTAGRYSTRPPGLNRTELRRFLDEYNERFRSRRGVRRSYRVLLAAARKTVP